MAAVGSEAAAGLAPRWRSLLGHSERPEGARPRRATQRSPARLPQPPPAQLPNRPQQAQVARLALGQLQPVVAARLGRLCGRPRHHEVDQGAAVVRQDVPVSAALHHAVGAAVCGGGGRGLGGGGGGGEGAGGGQCQLRLRAL